MENKQGGTADPYPSLRGVFPCGYRFRHKRHSERDAFSSPYAVRQMLRTDASVRMIGRRGMEEGTDRE